MPKLLQALFWVATDGLSTKESPGVQKDLRTWALKWQRQSFCRAENLL